MQVQNPLDPLIDQLTKLPGIGPKAAQRLAFFFLSLPAQEIQAFSDTLVTTKKTVRYCQTCFNLSLGPLCNICQDSSRERSVLCIVAQPRDILAVEKTRFFRGGYHVLGGLLSPIDGIYPEGLRIRELEVRLRDTGLKEIILAINPTIEGDATSLFLVNLLKPYTIPVSKLAYGLPVGSDMDYADEMTLQKAFQGRTKYE